jgi:hypothetical protein
MKQEPTVEYVGKGYVVMDYDTFNMLSRHAYASMNNLMNNAYRDGLGEQGRNWEAHMKTMEEHTTKVRHEKDEEAS